MLWSLLKIVVFLGIVALAAWAGMQLLETSGGVQIAVAGTEFTLGPLQSVIAVLVLLLVGWLIFKIVGLIITFIRWILGENVGPEVYFRRRRQKIGIDALSDSLMALASGEGRLALSKAETADKYLHRPQLTNLLTAQAAEMAGDRKKAEETYKKLLTDDRTRFVGVRGILKQKLEAGDTETALKLAEKAFSLKPRHEETQHTLLELQANEGDWSGARKTLAAKLKHGSLPRDVHKRRDAVLALSQAREATQSGSVPEAALEANRMSPDLIPAAVMAARVHIAKGKPKVAARTIKKAWESQPHPDLAAAFAEIAPNETPDERVKRFRLLTSINTDHPETKMLLAELFIAAEDFPAARKAIGDLAETDPTARSLTIMAAIERGLGADDAVVKGWLARALTAPRGPQWVCEDCHTPHAEWHPVCENCHHFDTLSWRRPPVESTPMVSGAEMLPLIVGSLEKPAEPEPAPEQDIIVESPEPVVDATPEPEAEPVDETVERPAPATDYVRDDGGNSEMVEDMVAAGDAVPEKERT